MARKKKTETIKKEEPVKEVSEKKLKYNPGVGEVIWVNYEDLPGTVLGKVYEFKNGAKARLVYLGEKAKMIIE